MPQTVLALLAPGQGSQTPGMLAEWLDANLPGMVEDLVKAEISRIAGKRS